MKKKKGFTLVELLVVIAILAVLATVSVVGYMGFTKKAHESNDASLTAQMNTALQANGVVKKNKTLTEAREDLLEAGIDLEKVTPTTDGYSYVWDSKQDLMFLLNEKRDVVAPTNATISANTVDSFVVIHNETEYNAWKSDYSLYFANGYESQTLTLTKLVGVDAGTSGINNISVKDDSSTADVTMYTTSGTLTIDAGKATVRHYGEVKTVSIKAIAGESYHEYGTVTGNVEVTKGRVELESTADVNTVLVSSSTSGDSKVDYNNGAKVGTVAPTTDAAKADVSSSTIPSESKQETIVDTTETSKFAGGLGTEKSPYLIETEDQIINIKNGKSKAAFKIISNLIVNEEIYLGGKKITIDLNGHSVELEYNDSSKKNNYATISTGGRGSKLVILDSSESQTGKVYGPDITINGKAPCAIRTNANANLEINGGHFYGRGQGNPCIFNWGTNATINIKNGEFETQSDYDNKYYVLNHQDGTKWQNMSSSKMIISGGTFYNYNPGVTKTEQDNAFAGKIYIADGYKTIEEKILTGGTKYKVIKSN